MIVISSMPDGMCSYFRLFIFKDLQDAAAEADFSVHQIFADVNAAKSAVAGDPDDRSVRVVACGDNSCPFRVRVVCIFDLNRYARPESRNQCFIMKDGKAGIRQALSFPGMSGSRISFGLDTIAGLTE